jgi:hypothetical protein
MSYLGVIPEIEAALPKTWATFSRWQSHYFTRQWELRVADLEKEILDLYLDFSRKFSLFDSSLQGRMQVWKRSNDAAKNAKEHGFAALVPRAPQCYLRVKRRWMRAAFDSYERGDRIPKTKSIRQGNG